VRLEKKIVQLENKLRNKNEVLSELMEEHVNLNRHGRIQNILATHGYENTDWLFKMLLCVFMVKKHLGKSEDYAGIA